MLDIQRLRTQSHTFFSIGNHPTLLQSMLDYDYLIGEPKPRLVGILSTGSKYARFMYGPNEILIPIYSSFSSIPESVAKTVSLLLNVRSARRTLSTTKEAFVRFPKLSAGVLFAENVPEMHAQELIHMAQQASVPLIGPASVGLIIPESFKLGAIAGVTPTQLVHAHVLESGSVAVLSSSGGMTNELIHLVTSAGSRISFSLSFGGDRFPITSPLEAFYSAQNDPQTSHIVYFGELGGYDEYDLAEAVKAKEITKPILCYIGGSISEMFESPPQFGHAKAMASKGEESAQAKTRTLRSVGVTSTDSFTQFLSYIQHLPHATFENKHERVSKKLELLINRKPSTFINSISRDSEGSVDILGTDVLVQANTFSYGSIVMSMLLGKRIHSKTLGDCAEFALKLLVDHGPYVSGAVNTMITARAGKDLVSGLVSGLLTIGPRFGGAINASAYGWLGGVSKNINPHEFVEEIARTGNRISGIGHKKYRIDQPDPRVAPILQFSKKLKEKKYTQFALDVEKITTAKKGNLILNVDGALAAVLLDLLHEEEGYSESELYGLVEIEFFNALFVLGRSVGFTSHYFDQRRKDQGLFRLSPREVTYIEM